MGAGIGLRGRTGSRKSEAGFTLIELLIVITVLSILTVSVSLAMSFGRSAPPAMGDAARFQAGFDRLSAAAIHSASARGMQVSATGWRVVQRDPGTGRWHGQGPEVRWQGSAVFRPTSRAAPTGLTRAPEVILLPDGRSTGFEIRFGGTDTCRTDGWTGLTCEPP